MTQLAFRLPSEPSRPRKQRRDGLPENTDYRDTGCEVSPSCLKCPLARCRYDVPGGILTFRVKARRARVAEMHDSGVPVESITRVTGVSRDTVERDLARRGRRRDDH